MSIDGRARPPVEDRLRALTPLFNVHAEAKLLGEAFGGLSRSTLYRALQSGSLGVRPIRVGRRLFLRRADVLDALGIPETPPGWEVPQHGTRQRDLGQLLLASPAPVVTGVDRPEAPEPRCGAPVEQAARAWSEALRR
jgi:hypothetical protein